MGEIKIGINKNNSDSYDALATAVTTSTFDWNSCTATAIGSLQGETSCYIGKSYFKNFKMPGNFKVFIDADKSSFKIGEVYIKEVIYNNPATIVLWSDGSKTTSKVDPLDIYNPEFGLLICILKKLVGGAAVVDLLEYWSPSLDDLLSIHKAKNKSIHKTLTETRQKFNKIWKAQKKAKNNPEVN
jgi:hypothetical protein